MWVLPVRCNLCPRQPRVKGKIARAALYDMLGGSATQERPPFEYKFLLRGGEARPDSREHGYRI